MIILMIMIMIMKMIRIIMKRTTVTMIIAMLYEKK